MRISLRCLLIALCLAAVGCAAKPLSLPVIRPAKLDVKGVQAIAIGGIKVGDHRDLYMQGRQGRWQTKTYKGPSSAVASQVKSELIDALSAVPHYRLIDTDAFNEIYSNSELAARAGKVGFNPDQAEAVLVGTVWAGTVWADSVGYRTRQLQAWDFSNPKQPRSRSWDVLLSAPQAEVSAAVALRLSLIRLLPTVEIVATQTVVKSYNDKTAPVIGDETMVPVSGLFSGGGDKQDKVGIDTSKALPEPNQLVALLTREAVTEFVERISPTRDTVTIAPVTGEDEVAAKLIAGHAYSAAAARLNRALRGQIPGVAYEERIDKAPDYYNLGLAYEAQGPEYLEDALRQYGMALALDEENEIYAAAVGRASRLLEQLSRFKLQQVLREEPEGP